MTTTSVRNGRSVWEYSLTRRKALEMREGEKAKCPEDIARFLRALEIQNEEQEHFLTIVLDVKNTIKGFFTVTIGLIDRAPVAAREVFRLAILQGASKVIVAHNHPLCGAQHRGCYAEILIMQSIFMKFFAMSNFWLGYSA